MKCEECGFDYESLAPADIPAALRAFPKRYRAPLSRFLPGEDGDSLVRERPEPDVWSALEYAAHVRDVFASYGDWIQQCLVEDRPVLEGKGPDELAVERRYNNEDDPAAVAEALAANAERVAATLEAMPAEGWDRVGLRRDEERPVLFTARRAVHEGGHHLLDIGRGLRALRDRRRPSQERSLLLIKGRQRGWVCPECGLNYDTISPQDAVVAVRSFPRRYRALLATPGSADGPDAVFRRRPSPSTWSALEYTAHVADVLDHLGPAIRRITVEDNPSISFFDNEERAAEQAYNELDRTEVLGWLDLASGELASVLAGVGADDWTRKGRLPDGEGDALTLARHGVHEGSHHLRDVQRVLAAVRGRRA